MLKKTGPSHFVQKLSLTLKNWLLFLNASGYTDAEMQQRVEDEEPLGHKNWRPKRVELFPLPSHIGRFSLKMRKNVKPSFVKKLSHLSTL